VNIQIIEKDKVHLLTVEEMVEMNPLILQIDERVPDIEGKAIDLISWYTLWAKASDQALVEFPTHLMVEASDEFTATISWSELQSAVLLFEQEGLPLKKGFPLRLYVPDGSSACLNVKSVMKLNFIHRTDLETIATYGFKNTVSIDDLRKK
jgi:hypothetical protein